ncbi:MAG: hypothetical protein KA734_04870 [Fluviicola sp.]|nr:hypothetical protein [Fluviicola sp.]MBP6271091.1 hypothetical protein [Fluviicola sp.]
MYSFIIGVNLINNGTIFENYLIINFKFKKMIKTILLVCTIIAGSSAFGQTKQVKKTTSMPKGKIETKKVEKLVILTPEERAERLTKVMTKQLNLTPSQVGLINEVNVGIAKKNDAVRNNQSLTAEQKKKMIEANNKARVEMYKQHLTPDQFKKFEMIQKEMESKSGKRKVEIEL